MKAAKVISFIIILIVLMFVTWTYLLDCKTKCKFLSEVKSGECKEGQDACFGIFVGSRDCRPKGCCCYRLE